NATMDAALDQGRQSTDQATRKKAYTTVQKQLLTDLPMLFQPVQPPETVFNFHGNFGNLSANLSGPLYDRIFIRSQKSCRRRVEGRPLRPVRAAVVRNGLDDLGPDGPGGSMGSRDGRVVIVSSDCHAGIPRARYRDYLDPKYHSDFDEYDASLDAWWETSPP